ncbi:type II toxin-antitoxin system RnlA family toxin [Pseudoalteromonas carrageenovora]|uniref:type II toxin-antitoxin system RnlA family toxin n=1 Tax=Pseudoalteromonas carrageenovora TaxID=227 RepID=UPI0026E40EC5|nr:type II toxin-antitoxin system RnlA family toxin [Pseudoalteromonas carrageenovora]MDO6545726.1 type II toxin-antitoxin system RnlA family toxin [Pseudoalteromonas carrageenovora]MDO6635659.1 type II toxin-antitoxin system RnlA family toxin [Pseudoalteromonas carrageenovora]MDO6649632.1 type II toxin-antitoxin system RnlA family toxin [Pseudoalteromonas carrageenovora]MDO6830347.1 type II toxin-antitoxin system RnlA family toxin [Pseudoalteromonas carrageenovora]
MSDFKNLNINRETLDSHIQKFLDSCNYQREDTKDEPNKKRILFGAAGAYFATVDLIFNKNGTTTIHWKLGKNHELGQELATYIKDTIDPAELETVNFSLKGVTTDSIEPIIECIAEADDIEVAISRDDDICKQVSLKSTLHQDTLKLTHHKTTRLLQIQGKPLSCYRRIIFMLTDLLDLKGLEQVLYRKDDSSAELVRKEMAEDYLRTMLTRSFEYLPEAVKKLLISSCCVKLASPSLPDYCLLLYPDLRALEGVLKQNLSEFDMSVGDAEHSFGTFFDVHLGICTLKTEYSARIGHVKMEEAFNQAYTFFRKHRNTIFHMEEFADGSRMIDTLDKAISLSKDTYAAIDGLYTARI